VDFGLLGMEHQSFFTTVNNLNSIAIFENKAC
jgi:hypothetical protein